MVSRDDRISVLFAADNVLAVPLAVSITSLLRARPAGGLDVHVLSCGISAGHRRRIERQFDGSSCALHWHEMTGWRRRLLFDVYARSLRPYPPAAYARLLAGEILAHLGKIIYFDTDIVVDADVGELWHAPLDGSAVLAVRDLPQSVDHWGRLKNVLSHEDRLRYSVGDNDEYFQSGVLVFDLDALRAATEELFSCLYRYPALTFPDNDALNIVFNVRKRLIDPRWNQMVSVFWDRAEDDSPYSPELFAELRERPFVIHYSGRPKPWEPGCTHPFRDKFDTAMAASAYAGWTQSPWDKLIERRHRAERVLKKRLYQRFAGSDSAGWERYRSRLAELSRA